MLIPFVLVAAYLLVAPKPPPITDPGSIARWANCDIGKVEWFVNQTIEYKLISGWRDGTACLTQGYGDCKCFATVHKEIMDSCKWTNRIVTIRKPKGDGNYLYHAVTLFVNPEGQTGYFNNNNYKFISGTDTEIIDSIHDGPWEYVHG